MSCFRSEFAGENFVRFSGDTTKHATAQLFAWEAHGKGVDVHLLAEPTKLELLQKEYEKKKEEFKSSVSGIDAQFTAFKTTSASKPALIFNSSKMSMFFV